MAVNEEGGSFGQPVPRESQEPKKNNPETEYPLFGLLREIIDALQSKEAQSAHHMDRIATALEKTNTLLEKMLNMPPAGKTEPAPPMAKPYTPPIVPTPTPKPTPTPTPTSDVVSKVKAHFSPDLEEMLTFEDMGNWVRIAPRRFLGSDNFAKIASIVRAIGGEYVSAGKDSHFKILKTNIPI